MVGYLQVVFKSKAKLVSLGRVPNTTFVVFFIFYWYFLPAEILVYRLYSIGYV